MAVHAGEGGTSVAGVPTTRAQGTSHAPEPGRAPTVCARLCGALADLAMRTSVLPRPAAGLLCAALLVGVTTVVAVSGGTHSGMTHLYYAPIVLAALVFATPGAAAVALVAALLTGPFMPLDTAAGEAQPAVTWLLRAAVFLGVGLMAGAAVQIRTRAFDTQLAADLLGTMERPVTTRTPVDRDLVPHVRRVLTEGCFHAEYQPIYSLEDGRLVSVEAVTRFDTQPTRTPDRWFATAHAAGLGIELEVAAIAIALEGARDLPDGVGLSVNASPAALADCRLLDLVRRCERRPLTVEITEHAVIEDYPILREALAALVSLGVDLAVDDAGAGFASLQHIVQLEPDVIKLDMSLTQDIAASPLRKALATSLIEFTERSGARLVVEGIETVADLTAWAGLGAHAVQGFVVGRPAHLPAAPHSALIRSLPSTAPTAWA